MSGVFGNPWLYNPAEPSFYSHTIDQSLRFDGSTSFLHFTPTSNAATDSSKMTFSTWVKTWGFGISDGYILSAGSSYIDGVGYNPNHKFTSIRNGGVGGGSATGNGVRRDPSAWYHLYVIYDADAGYNRIYVNGVLDGEASTSSDLGKLGVQNQLQRIVRKSNASTYLDLYLAETHFVDGSIVPISTFAETKDGVWIPVETSGITYGNNGWYLNYADKSDIGKDVSGRGNHWTPSGLAASDVVPDSPSLNYPTYNPLVRTGQTLTHKEGNLEVASSSFWSSSVWSRMTMAGHGGGTGKFYAEFVNYGSSGGGSTVVGVGNYHSLATNTVKHNDAIIYYYDYIEANGSRINIGGNYSSPPGISGNEVVRMCWDCSNGKVWIGGSQEFFDVGSGVGDPANGNNPSGTISNFTNAPIGVLHNRSVNTGRCIMNFGQNGTFNGTLTAGGYSDENGYGDFFYQVPSGFVALNSATLSQPTIGPQADSIATDHFNTLTYTGNTGTLEVDGLNFRPDFLWIKRTDASQNFSNGFLNSVRGNTKGVYSNRTTSEFTSTGTNDLQSFDDDGFTIGQSNQFSGNDNGGTFAAWSWKAGGTAPTKTYKVVVVDDGGNNRYRFRNSADSATFAQTAVTLDLQEGGTYTFDVSDSTVSNHPFVIGTAANSSEYSTGVIYKLDGVAKTYSQYTSGFSSATSRLLIITVAASAPTLYYWCSVHSGMGGQINTNSTFGSTNFNGTLLSVESVNETAGFSILTYSGSLSSSGTASVGHSLGAKPSAIISKSLDNSGADSGEWIIWHDELPTDNYVLRFDTAAESNKSGNGDMASLFTATTFGTNYTVGSNVTGNDYIAYLFREIPQYSKFGQFRGNSNSNGTFVYTNFRVAFLLVKSTVSGTSWLLYDNKRNGFNVENRASYAASALGQASDDDVDLLSNGFKWRRSSPNFNQTGYSEYIYFAIGDQAFKFSNAR